MRSPLKFRFIHVICWFLTERTVGLIRVLPFLRFSCLCSSRECILDGSLFNYGRQLRIESSELSKRALSSRKLAKTSFATRKLCTKIMYSFYLYSGVQARRSPLLLLQDMPFREFFCGSTVPATNFRLMLTILHCACRVRSIT